MRIRLLGLLVAAACGSSSKPPDPPTPSDQPVVAETPIDAAVADDTTPTPDAAEGEIALFDAGAPAAPVDAGPPAIPANSQNVKPQLLEQNRLSGDKQLVPDDATKEAIQKSGKTKIIGAFKMCLDDTGAVYLVNVLKSTGFPAYDDLIVAGMKTWTYKPFLVDGKAIPVCTAVTFIYSQKP